MKTVTMGDRRLQVHDRSVALQALIVGGAMVQAAQSAEVQGIPDPDSSFSTLWTCGLVLIVIGASWVGKTTLSSLGCCLKRLHRVISAPHHPRDLCEGDDGSGPERRRSWRRAEEEGAHAKSRAWFVATTTLPPKRRNSTTDELYVSAYQATIGLAGASAHFITNPIATV